MGYVSSQLLKIETDRYYLAKAKYVWLFCGVSCLLAMDGACVFHFYLIAGTEQKLKIQICPEMLSVMWSKNWNGSVVILVGESALESALQLLLLLSLSSLPPSCLPLSFFLTSLSPLPLPPPFWSQIY